MHGHPTKMQVRITFLDFDVASVILFGKLFSLWMPLMFQNFCCMNCEKVLYKLCKKNLDLNIFLLANEPLYRLYLLK